MTDLSRQAALRLYDTRPEDREWVLAQLQEQDRSQLREMLQELAELGIPSDVSVRTEIEATQHEDDRVKNSKPKTLRDASAEHVLGVLGDEPAWLISTVLNIEDWAWRDSFIAGLYSARRSAIERMPKRMVRPGLAEALVSSIELRLADYSEKLKKDAASKHRPMTFLRRFNGIKRLMNKWPR